MIIKYLKMIFIFLVVISFNGCSKVYTEVPYFVKTKNIEIKKINRVDDLRGYYIKNKCLWIRKHNTNLCDEDLNVILTHINKLRQNEKSCDKIVDKVNGIN